MISCDQISCCFLVCFCAFGAISASFARLLFSSELLSVWIFSFFLVVTLCFSVFTLCGRLLTLCIQSELLR